MKTEIIELSDILKKNIESKLNKYSKEERNLVQYSDSIVEHIFKKEFRTHEMVLKANEGNKDVFNKPLNDTIINVIIDSIRKEEYHDIFKIAVRLANYFEKEKPLKPYFMKLLLECQTFENLYRQGLEVDKRGLESKSKELKRKTLEFQEFCKEHNLISDKKEINNNLNFITFNMKGKEVTLTDSWLLYSVQKAIFNNPNVIEIIEDEIIDKDKLSSTSPKTKAKPIFDMCVIHLYDLLKDIDAYKTKAFLPTKLCKVIAELLDNPDYDSKAVDTTIRAYLTANT